MHLVRWLPVLSVLTLASVSDARAQPASEAELAAKSEQVRQLMGERKFEQAIPLCRELVRAVPNNAGLLLNLGMALHMAGYDCEAIPQLQKAVKIDASILPAWLFLGASHLALGELEQAIRPLQKVLELQPDMPNAHELLGDAYLGTERYEEATSQYQGLVRLDPRDPHAWYGLNRSSDGMARRLRDEIARTAPESAWWLSLVGDERFSVEQYRSAFFFYREALSKKPDLRGLHTSLAEVYRKTGHADWAATEDAREPKPAGPCGAGDPACAFFDGKYGEVLKLTRQASSPDSMYWRAKALRQLSLEASSRLEALPESSEIHQLKALGYQDRRRHLEAAKEWEAAVKLIPDDPRLQLEWATSLYRANDYEHAMPIVEGLLKRQPADAELNFLKGDMLLSAQEAEKAIPFLKAAAKSDPKLLPAQHALGRAFVQAGQPAEAIPHILSALPIDEDGTLRFQLARAYQATGQTALAKETLQKYQEMQKADREEKTKLEEQLQITAP